MTRKLLIAILLIAPSAFAQSNVQISLGVTYANGSLTIQRLPAAGSLVETRHTFLGANGDTFINYLVPGSMYGFRAITSSNTGQLYAELLVNGAPQDLSAALLASPSSSASAKNTIDGSNPIYGLFWDTVEGSDGAWGSGVNPTVTSNQVTFAAADVGKTFKGTSGGFACGENQSVTSITLLSGTIASITDAHHVVVTGTASAQSTGSSCFAYGHLDDTGISAMEAAAKASLYCPTIILPPGMGMINNPHFTDKTMLTSGTPCAVIPGQISSQQGPIIKGSGLGQSSLVLGPLFPATACNAGVSSNGCMGGISGAVYRDFDIRGICDARTGVSTPAVAFLVMSYADYIDNVIFSCFGQGYTGGFSSVAFNGSEGGVIGFITVDGFGSAGVLIQSGLVPTPAHSLLVADIPTGGSGNIVVSGGAQLFVDHLYLYFGGPAGTGTDGVVVQVGGTLQANFLDCGENLGTNQHNGIVNSGTTIIDGGLCLVNGNSGGIPIVNLSGGIVKSQNLYAKGGTAGFDFVNVSGATFIDQGGNVPAGGHISSQAGSTWGGVGAFKGSCSGVATSSSTLGLYGLGQNAALTCTSTVTTLGKVADKPGTAYGVIGSATAGGVNASSGVITVLKNGVAQTVTCTLGTTTSCADTTHTFAFVAGDVISVQFTTQAAETLAGVTATVVTM